MLVKKLILSLSLLLYLLIFIGCKDPVNDITDNNITDPALNGTWVYVFGDMVLETYRNNGYFESTINTGPPSDFVGFTNKGTYTTDSGTLIETVTHRHGGFIDMLTSASNIEDRWYTRDELENTLSIENFPANWDADVVAGMIQSQLDLFGAYPPHYYVINGSILTISNMDGEVTSTSTRK